MKPKIEPRYVTSAGQDVKTLTEWKIADVDRLMAQAMRRASRLFIVGNRLVFAGDVNLKRRECREAFAAVVAGAEVGQNARLHEIGQADVIGQAHHRIELALRGLER